MTGLKDHLNSTCRDEETPLLDDREGDGPIQIATFTSTWFSDLYRSWQFYLGAYLGVCTNSGILISISSASHRHLAPFLSLQFGILQAVFAVLTILATFCCWVVSRCLVVRPRVRMPLLFVWNGFLAGLSVNFFAILASCIVWRKDLASSADLLAMFHVTYLVFLPLVIIADIAISYILLRFRDGEKTNAMGLTKDQMAVTGPFASIFSTWPQANAFFWCLVFF
ncbi:hypothetical protein HDU83_008206 [Entophlyctis luteolus]|nr:hypothetical protein HDU83_008206 [Entophlyctis luteolus]